MALQRTNGTVFVRTMAMEQLRRRVTLRGQTLSRELQQRRASPNRGEVSRPMPVSAMGK